MSDRHCGGCNEACVAPDLGSAMCTDGMCLTECDVDTHVCDGACVSDTDVNFCSGADLCSPCPSDAPNVESMACVDQACEATCADGFFDCDGDPSNGCEAELEGDDPRNCGECGLDCGYGRCSAGVCTNAVRSFAVGPRHACATLNDGTAWCWGANELGQSAIRESGGPVPRPNFIMESTEPLLSFRELDDTTSYIEMNGVFTNIRIMFWGDDPTNELAGPVSAPQMLISSLGTIPFDVGGGSGFALIDSGSGLDLMGWGRRDFGAFADFIPPGIGPIPVGRLQGVNSVLATSSLSRGERVTCARSGTSPFPDLFCWGQATPGETVYVGNGSDRGASSPAEVTPPAIGARFATDSAFDLGFRAACAPFADPGAASRFACWGEWDCGFPTREVLTPVEVAGPNNANTMNLSVGESQACGAQTGTGRMICWGRDYEDPRVGACRPAQVEPYPEYEDITQVQLGRAFGCFLRRVGGSGNNGSLFCWGSNRHGQLGTGDSVSVSGPRQVVFATRPPD